MVMKQLAAGVLAALLVACGGGGGGDDAAPASVDAQGFWSGSDFSLLITDGGEVWAVEDFGTEGLLLIQGRASTTSGGELNGSVRAFYGDGTLTASVAGTVKPRQSIAGTVTVPGAQPSNFTASYDASYEQPAKLGDLQGIWSVTGGVLRVDASGALTYAGSDGCQATGNARPDGSGKNYFRVAVTYGAGCGVPPGSAGNGVAVADGRSLVAGVISGETGAALSGSK